MKQQTKKEIWYWLIIGVAILLILVIYYGASRKTNQQTRVEQKIDDQQTPINQDGQVEDQEEKDKLDEQEEETGKGGADLEQTYQSDQSGGELGQNYLLDDVAVVGGGDYDKLKINLLPNDSQVLPKWQANQNNEIISISLSDTNNYDITTGSKVYTGPAVLISNNKIRKVKIDASSGDQLFVKMVLDKERVYKITKATDPLRLVVKVY
jgi:hypothetical protein